MDLLSYISMDFASYIFLIYWFLEFDYKEHKDHSDTYFGKIKGVIKNRKIIIKIKSSFSITDAIVILLVSTINALF
jgi:hypothetical protein